MIRSLVFEDPPVAFSGQEVGRYPCGVALILPWCTTGGCQNTGSLEPRPLAHGQIYHMADGVIPEARDPDFKMARRWRPYRIAVGSGANPEFEPRCGGVCSAVLWHPLLI